MLPNKDVSQTANCSPETFRSIEESIGISPALFAKKFIFAQQSNTDAFLLAPNTPSPSQLAGIDLEIIKKATSLMSELLFKAGESLQVPISTTIVAISIAHFYFSRRSLVEFDLRDCCLGAMFLACKSEETLRKSYQVAAVFDYVFKVPMLSCRHLKDSDSLFGC